MNTFQFSASKKKISITSKIKEGMCVVADKDLLELLLRNILSNAVKFTDYCGKITIQAYESEKETIIAIKDTGKGMEYEKVKTIFKESYITSTIGTAGEKGIGLGLLICKEIIIKYNGKIWVYSFRGQGSTFYFSILTADKK